MTLVCVETLGAPSENHVIDPVTDSANGFFAILRTEPASDTRLIARYDANLQQLWTRPLATTPGFLLPGKFGTAIVIESRVALQGMQGSFVAQQFDADGDVVYKTAFGIGAQVGPGKDLRIDAINVAPDGTLIGFVEATGIPQGGDASQKDGLVLFRIDPAGLLFQSQSLDYAFDWATAAAKSPRAIAGDADGNIFYLVQGSAANSDAPRRRRAGWFGNDRQRGRCRLEKNLPDVWGRRLRTVR